MTVRAAARPERVRLIRNDLRSVSLRARRISPRAPRWRLQWRRDAFPHKAHLRMAWLYVTRLGPEAAIERAAGGIRNLAKANGRPTLYHDTLTRAWVYLVAAAVATSSAVSFTEFLALNPRLVDKRLLLAGRTLKSTSRAIWIAPDLAPIPGALASSVMRNGAEPTRSFGASGYA
jgi:hypothetical protein